MAKRDLDNLWTELAGMGSGFTLDAERNYKEKGQLCYHLRMYGLIYEQGYEVVGYSLPKVIKQAIKQGNRGFDVLNHKIEKGTHELLSTIATAERDTATY